MKGKETVYEWFKGRGRDRPREEQGNNMDQTPGKRERNNGKDRGQEGHLITHLKPNWHTKKQQ